MNAEDGFGRWSAVGVPFFLLGGAGGALAIHLGRAIAWHRLMLPIVLLVAVQTAFYLGAFWAGKAARDRGMYWPVLLLGGLYLWAAGLLILHYGAEWKLLRPTQNLMPFTLFMTGLTVIASVAAQWFAARQQDESG